MEYFSKLIKDKKEEKESKKVAKFTAQLERSLSEILRKEMSKETCVYLK